VRRFVLIAALIGLIASVVVADASANYLRASRAARLARQAVERDFANTQVLRVLTCSRRSPHRVLCSVQFNQNNSRCTGPVVVQLSHRTGRVRRSTAALRCVPFINNNDGVSP
jgi:hypothetical protein